MGAATIGLGIAAVGAGTSFFGKRKQSRAARESSILANQQNQAQFAASQQIATLTKEQEALRRRQARLDFVRRRRDIIRQGQAARGLAVNNAANAGALGSSASQGGIGQIQHSTGANIAALDENFDIGEQNFEINEDITDVRNSLAGQISTFNNQRSILDRRLADAGGQIALGDSLFRIGSNTVQNAETIERVGSTVFGGASRRRPASGGHILF